MTQQTKRAPGRPKSTQAKSQPSVTVKKPPIIRKEQEVSGYNFYAPNGGIMFMLKGQDAVVFSEETQALRRLRYCPDDPSVWADEQYNGSRAKPVIFRMKNLFVQKHQTNLLEYLERHPDNKKNGGSLFYKIETKVNKEKEMEDAFTSHDAVSLVRDTDIEELLPVALYHGVNVDRSVSDIRYDLLQLAKSKPVEFMSSFDSPVVKARAAVHQAGQYGIISLKPNGAYWGDTNRMIVANPTGQDCIETMTRFCLTEKGASVLADINDQLEKLA